MSRNPGNVTGNADRRQPDPIFLNLHVLTDTRGIIFRTLKYSETSVIADIYTLDHGLMSYIISGVRKKNARTHASVLQLMNIVDMVAYHSEKKKLHRIREIRPAVIFTSIPFDVRKSAICMFLAELCSKTIKETEANTAKFKWIQRQLIELDHAQADFADVHIKFLLGLARFLGFGPQVSESDSDLYFDLLEGRFVDRLPEHPYYISDVKIFNRCLAAEREARSCELNRQERNWMIDQLVMYYKLQIDNFPGLKSHQILREVL